MPYLESGNNELVRVEGLILVRETDRAWGCSIDPTRMRQITVWLPKSELGEHGLEYLVSGWAEMPRWLADSKELEYEE